MNAGRKGLCPDCKHVKIVETGRSTFYRCTLAGGDPRFMKYPPQPVVACPGHEPGPAGMDAGGSPRPS